MKAEGVVVPDSTERIVAARMWRTTPSAAGLRALTSLSASGYGSYTQWPRDQLAAVCGHLGWRVFVVYGSEVPDAHDAPDPDCQCGIWGLADPFDLIAYQPERGVVFGVVEMWGRVICAEKGWRGQFARVAGIVPWNPKHPRQAESEAAGTYGVPLLTGWPELTAPLPTFMQPVPEKEPEPEPERAAETDLQIALRAYGWGNTWTSESVTAPSSSNRSTNLPANPSPNRFRRLLNGLSKNPSLPEVQR